MKFGAFLVALLIGDAVARPAETITLLEAAATTAAAELAPRAGEKAADKSKAAEDIKSAAKQIVKPPATPKKKPSDTAKEMEEVKKAQDKGAKKEEKPKPDDKKAKVPLPNADWTKKQCTDKGVKSASDSSSSRWKALDTNNALIWTNNKHESEGKKATLPYVEWMLDLYHGPEGWDCEKINNKPCSGSIQCDQVGVPAMYHVANSIGSLHQILQNSYSAIDTARSDLEFSLGPFMETFCPNKKPDVSLEIFKTIIDTLTFAAGIASARLWNKVITTGPQLSGDQRGWMKDSANAGIAYIMQTSKDNLKKPKDQVATQNKMAHQANIYFQTMMASFESYNKQIFSGKGNYKQQLYNLLRDGAFMPNNNLGFDVGDMKLHLRSLVYAKMLPEAWRISPKQKFIPLVLESDDACGSDKRGSTTSKAMSDKTAKATRVCVDGKYMYLLSANTMSCRPLGDETCPDEPKDFFESLPGGTNEELNGKNWGHLKLEDIVKSVHAAYKKGGNDYKLDDKAVGKKPMESLASGLQVPGYYDIPFCPQKSSKDIINRMTDGTKKQGKHWPCE